MALHVRIAARSASEDPVDQLRTPTRAGARAAKLKNPRSRFGLQSVGNPLVNRSRRIDPSPPAPEEARPAERSEPLGGEKLPGVLAGQALKIGVQTCAGDLRPLVLC